MNGPIVVMKRYEFKYVLSPIQVSYLQEQISSHMILDDYGMTSIASLYYDTPNHRLIRASIEKPAYKEKIRLRSYGIADENSNVYLELKRKAYGVVYKRRVQSHIADVDRFFHHEGEICNDGQIAREISYFRDYYENLEPACLIIYDRQAYYSKDSDLRLTIDQNPRYRMDNLNLTTNMDGELLLPKGSGILEIKVQDAIPLWLSAILAKGKIYKSSFSKYGEAYKMQTLKEVMQER